MKMIIVTGMSGSGKTVALKMFEDFGYYCVDNLPVELLLNFVDLTIESERGMKGIALGIDIRSGLNGLQEVFDELSHKKINMEILFLEADDETLIKRYKETRRNHPLASEGRLIDGINLERERLAFLRERADRILDTGRFLTKELKQELKKIYVDGKSFNNLFVTVLSFGYMYGIPDDPDLLFDVRFLPNPFYDQKLRLKTGEEKEVSDYVFSNNDADIFLDKLDDMIKFLIPRYIDEGKSALVIGIGCTGGQHRSVAIAAALKEKNVKRIILTRPAVEAGESLGFLPGDLKEKLDPYLQPLYDALRDMIPHERLENFIEKRVIEVAPLAFMRGRTLDDAFVILDEAQNTTHSQMKMFLTRMGMNAKFIITGDPSQIDLPKNQQSGLQEAMKILRNVEEIGFIHLNESDVVRHPIVKKIILAYNQSEKK